MSANENGRIIRIELANIKPYKMVVEATAQKGADRYRSHVGWITVDVATECLSDLTHKRELVRKHGLMLVESNAPQWAYWHGIHLGRRVLVVTRKAFWLRCGKASTRAIPICDVWGIAEDGDKPLPRGFYKETESIVVPDPLSLESRRR